MAFPRPFPSLLFSVPFHSHSSHLPFFFPSPHVPASIGLPSLNPARSLGKRCKLPWCVWGVNFGTFYSSLKGRIWEHPTQTTLWLNKCKLPQQGLGKSPSRKSNLVHFSFKVLRLVASILLFFSENYFLPLTALVVIVVNYQLKLVQSHHSPGRRTCYWGESITWVVTSAY